MYINDKHSQMDTNSMHRSLRMLFRMNIPRPSDLCCATVSIDPNDNKDPSAKSPFHSQIFKCRMLLFTNPVLASPVWGTERDILVVASRRDQEEGRLDRYFTDLRLRRVHAGGRHVTDRDYSACLLYSLRAHLAPLWNGVDDLLIEGRDFLSATDPKDAVKLDLNTHGAEDGCAWLSLEAHRVRVPHLDPIVDLGIHPQDFHEFLNTPDLQLETRSMANPWVHVYPSMKKGMVINITKRIPSTCLYPTYNDLRKHWKNMYGYRLPEEEKVYCEVYFKPLGWNLYTYPLVCLSSYSPNKLRARDPHAIAKAFLEALVRKMPAVCGQPIEVHSDTFSLPVRDLRPAGGEGVADEDRPNLHEEQLIPGTCPLSVASQPGVSKPAFMWHIRPQDQEADSDVRPSEGKENSPPQATAGQPEPFRPVFRPVFNKTPVRTSLSNPKPPVPDKPKFKPIFKPTSNRSALPSREPPSQPPAGPRSPLQPQQHAIQAHKPIFLSIEPKAPGKLKAAKESSKRKEGSTAVRQPFHLQDRGAGPPAAERQPFHMQEGPPAAARKSSKRPAEDQPLPNFTSAEQVRKANAQTLIAWLRANGVSCRVKDKKAELVEKTINKLGF